MSQLQTQDLYFGYLVERERQGPSFLAHFVLCLLSLKQRGPGLQAGFVISKKSRKEMRVPRSCASLGLQCSMQTETKGYSVGDNAD